MLILVNKSAHEGEKFFRLLQRIVRVLRRIVRVETMKPIDTVKALKTAKVKLLLALHSVLCSCK